MSGSSDIPMDVLFTILTLLPVKSLLRFKCVCKTLQDMINSPEFIKAHLNRSLETNPNHSVVFLTDYPDSSLCLYQGRDRLLLCPPSLVKRSTRISTLNSPRRRKTSRIVGSCNGLLCVHTDGYLELYNPSTRMSRQIFYPKQKLQCMFFGFGYDSLGDEYKIVGLSSDQTLVYSLREDLWRRPIGDNEILSHSHYVVLQDGVLANSCLHWIARQERESVDQLIVFHLSNESWSKLPVPDHKKGLLLQLGLFDERICLRIATTQPSRFGTCKNDVWIMKEYGVKESWTKLVSFDAIGGVPLPYFNEQNDIVLFKGWFTNNRGSLYRGKFKNKESEIVELISTYDNINPSILNLTLCVDSLTSVTHDHGLIPRKRIICDGQSQKQSKKMRIEHNEGN